MESCSVNKQLMVYSNVYPIGNILVCCIYNVYIITWSKIPNLFLQPKYRNIPPTVDLWIATGKGARVRPVLVQLVINSPPYFRFVSMP